MCVYLMCVSKSFYIKEDLQFFLTFCNVRFVHSLPINEFMYENFEIARRIMTEI